MLLRISRKSGTFSCLVPKYGFGYWLKVITIFNRNIAYRGWKRATKIARAREYGRKYIMTS